MFFQHRLYKAADWNFLCIRVKKIRMKNTNREKRTAHKYIQTDTPNRTFVHATFGKTACVPVPLLCMFTSIRLIESRLFGIFSLAVFTHIVHTGKLIQFIVLIMLLLYYGCYFFSYFAKWMIVWNKWMGISEYLCTWLWTIFLRFA